MSEREEFYAADKMVNAISDALGICLDNLILSTMEGSMERNRKVHPARIRRAISVLLQGSPEHTEKSGTAPSVSPSDLRSMENRILKKVLVHVEARLREMAPQSSDTNYISEDQYREMMRKEFRIR